MIALTTSKETSYVVDAARMDSNVESSLVESDKPPLEELRSPALWLLSALAGPALVRVGEHVLPTTLRLWLDRLTQGVQAALDALLHRPTQVRLASGAPEAATRPPAAFAFGLTLPGAQRESVLTFDLAAARALADAVSKDMAHLRGDGLLTDTECGLLEYLALCCADSVLATLPATGGFAFTRFCGPRELDKILRDAPVMTIDFELSVGGRTGHVRLALEESGPNYVAHDPREENASEPNSGSDDERLLARVELRLALPTITLNRQEFKAMQPGDLLLLGCAKLESFATDCAIVTTNGWRLSSAQLLSDSLGLVSVRCDALRPAVNPAFAVDPAGNTVLLQPWMGGISRSLEQLSRWQTGDVIDFLKDRNTPLELRAGPTRIGAGELALVENELGIRLLELAHSAGRTEGAG